jgi:hypothetical protein
MKKIICGVSGMAVLLSVLFVIGITQGASAQVQVNVNIITPPPLQFAAPPDVVVIPSGVSYVYMVPNNYGVYFYGGHWYRFYNGYWFRSSIYNGYWDYIDLSMVPRFIIAVPPEYVYYVPSGYYRIHYHDLHKSWGKWDKGHHWHNYDWYKYETRDDIRRERYSQIERGRKHHDVPQNQRYGAQKPKHYDNHKSQRYDSPGPQQHGSQKPQHYDNQKPHRDDVQKPQQQDVPKYKQQAYQTPQHPNGQKQK